MTARFDAFEIALMALCEEHGVILRTGYDDEGYSCLRVEEESDEDPAGLDVFLFEVIPPTPEEVAAEAERMARQRAEQAARDAERAEAAAIAHARLLASKEYRRYQRVIDADAKKQRKKQMRVSTDPTDPAYIDARPRKAWCNDILIEGWTVADEFRRCVITPDKVHNGSVRIERLPACEPAPTPAEIAAFIADEAATPAVIEWPQIEEAAPIAPAPKPQPVKHGKRR